MNWFTFVLNLSRMDKLQPTPVTDTSVPSSLTDAERAYALEALQTTRASLRQALDGLSPAQLAHKPSPDRWSIAECAEHIVLVEGGIFQAIQFSMDRPADPDRRAQIRVSDVDVIKAVRSRAATFPAPDAFVPTGRFADIEATLQVFDQQRDAVLEYVRTTPIDFRTHYFKHPALGLLDTYQAILVIASHGERHRKQIEEVKASPGFPA